MGITQKPNKSHGLGGRRVQSNSPSYYSSREGAWPDKMSRAFELAPIKYQHTITNDNVTDIEVGLMGVLAARSTRGEFV